jgi:hypothetical protein
MASQGDVETPITGEMITFLETTHDTGGELLRLEYVLSQAESGEARLPRPRVPWEGILAFRARVRAGENRRPPGR